MKIILMKGSWEGKYRKSDGRDCGSYVLIHQTADWFDCFLTACGGTIYIHDANSDGYVTSPNYPANYPQHAECIWILEAPSGRSIQLQFEDQFNIEETPK